ncbi:MAG: hypothetical protein MUC92_06470 [Fimbriimonadaceae bacterium]|jgi:hypothetical protein|nr:hypothetical protein [Fimbriimonadaceae bacterium]
MATKFLLPTTVLLILAFLAGCANQQAAGTATPEKPAAGASTTPTTPEPAPDPSAIPAELRHDALAYYGLLNKEALTYEYIPNKGATPESGAQQVEFRGMEKGQAKFTILRTGALAILGSDDVNATQEGLFTTRTQLGTMDPPMLALPKDLTVGKEWKVDQKLKAPDGTDVTMNLTNKVARQEKIKVPAGEFDALLITANGQMKLANGTRNVRANSWYVKDIGVVKIELISKDNDGNDVNSIIQLKQAP